MYSCYYILTLMATLAAVTHTLGRNDRGVTPTGESFIPLTPFQLQKASNHLLSDPSTPAE